jgi:GT2 family glycosyltransferase
MTLPSLGVVVVTFNAADVILDCLVSLLAATGVRLEVVVVDNASTDATIATLHDWASGAKPYQAPADLPFGLVPPPGPVSLAGVPGANGHAVTLIAAQVNSGFAGGVNRGLAHLAARPEIHRFWILNPDSAVPPQTPAAFATFQAGGPGFSLMGGRVIYYDDPDVIQIDGGFIGRWTGVTHNANQYASPRTTPSPDPARLDFITGASMVASRAFLEASGLMPEEYFLYYEEVDWAMRRRDLPLAYCSEAIVYHRAGTAIGSPTLGRPASPFSLYFKHRGRLRFVRRHLRLSLPVALAYSAAKAGQLALKGYWAEAWSVVAGSLGLPPPNGVRARLSKEAARLAFGR